MSNVRETLERVNRSPALRITNLVLGVAALGFTVQRYRKNPTMWNALPVARGILVVAESFRPVNTQQ